MPTVQSYKLATTVSSVYRQGGFPDVILVNIAISKRGSSQNAAALALRE